MITVKPSNPTSDDNVELLFTYAGCPLSVVQHQFGTEFRLVFDDSGACDFSPPPYFEHTWDVGHIPGGKYSATFYTSYLGGPQSLIYSQDFIVSPYPSPIPTVSGAVLSFLALALVIAACIRIKQHRLHSASDVL